MLFELLEFMMRRLMVCQRPNFQEQRAWPMWPLLPKLDMWLLLVRGRETLRDELRPFLVPDEGTPERRALSDANLRPYGDMPVLEWVLEWWQLRPYAP